MAIKKHKPTSPGRRSMTTLDRESSPKNSPHKQLVRKIHKHGGRDNSGRIAVEQRLWLCMLIKHRQALLDGGTRDRWRGFLTIPLSLF